MLPPSPGKCSTSALRHVWTLKSLHRRRRQSHPAPAADLLRAFLRQQKRCRPANSETGLFKLRQECAF
jgi:hypothetical protein